jgi:hypothetical protein
MPASYNARQIMKVSREFKANFTAWGFFLLSVLVFAVIALAIWNSRTSHRLAPPPAGSVPPAERVEQ